ncbi:MAG: EAL domain-containing protein [Pseudomonadota bacterium]
MAVRALTDILHPQHNHAVGMAVADAHGRVLSWNRKAGEIFGAQECAALGDLFQDGERQRWKNYLQQAVASASPRSAVFARSAHGAVRWVEAIAVALEKQPLDFLILTFQDVTEHIDAARRITDANARLQQQIEERERAERALQQSHERLELAQEAGHVGIFDWNVQTGAVVWTEELKKMFGLQEFGGHYLNWAEHVHPDDRARAEAAVQSSLQGGARFDIDYRIIRPDGATRWIAAHGHIMRDERGAPLHFIGVNVDVTERKETEDRLRRSEERYRALYEDNPSMYFTLDAACTILSVNKFGSEQLGYSPEELVGKPILDYFYAEDRAAVYAHFQACLAQPMETLNWEFRKVRKDGDILWVRDIARAVPNIDGDTVILLICNDITERKQVEEQLLHNAHHDALTGLPNQVLFMDLLAHVIGSAKRRPHYMFAVLFLDLDRFKIINDSLGHMVGDQLLVAVAQRLEAGLRPGDTVARFGGDEFMILLDGVKDAAEAEQIAERIHKELSKPLPLDNNAIYTTASIGIALSSPAIQRPEDILRDADIAMYRAKAHGRARYEVFDRSMHAHALELWELEGDLRRAIEHQEFDIHYQPIVSLISGKITGVEALARWRHPQRGLVYPEQFISLAEETRLIRPIGERILRAACAQAKVWQSGGFPHLHMAVNCSALEFQDQHLPELIKNVLRETGVAPHTLRVEITESLAMQDIDFSVSALKELTTMGVQISIDDFGTGYSSLAYLKRFPITNLKIDHSFVKDMTRNTDDAAITAAIIAMAHSLKLRVIAEGVETEEQLNLLRAQRCDGVQGFLFSEALPAEALSRLLREDRQLLPA